ncbi:cytochrome c biogenesis protein CcdA [Candidatus Woesebacteria bacterium]|nr:cytochrome c biogenesis protein CcdA [Candidatus Woesebacteria bacterium]
MFETLLDGSTVNIFIAFLGGFLTFFCLLLLPLVPTYLAFLSGHGLTHTNVEDRWHLLKVAFAFVFGFVTTFVLIGFVLNRFALVLGPYRIWLTRVGGLLFLLMGLFILGVGKQSILQREFKVVVPSFLQNWKLFYAWLTGLAFGFGWTPCIGPVLAVILYWSTQQATALQGFFLLISYGLGLGVPFLLVAVAFDRIFPFFQKSQKIARALHLASGILIVITGVLMLANQFSGLSLLFLHLVNWPVLTQ